MLIKYTGKYVNIYFNMKITFFFPTETTMPPTEKLQRKKNPSLLDKVRNTFHKYVNRAMITDLIFAPKYLWVSAVAFLLAEIAVNIFIIWKVKCK